MAQARREPARPADTLQIVCSCRLGKLILKITEIFGLRS